MSKGQLLYDGLWRCLCPAFDRMALHRAVRSNSSTLLRQARRPVKPKLSMACAIPMGARPYGSTTTTEPSQVTGRILPQEQASGREFASPGAANWEQRLLAPKPPTEEALKASSVDDISTALIALRDPRGWSLFGQDIDRFARIQQLVRYLLGPADQRLGPFVYECMMDAMIDPEGSALGVRKLFEDAASKNIKPTAAMCQSALDALAVHPDYALRQDILDIMQESWFTITMPAKQSVVLGLLRDEQYELAYQRLTEMIEQGGRVDTWVYDIFILVFGRLRFLDEMMDLVYRRKIAKGSDTTMCSLLYYALDVCSQAYHESGTQFAWNTVVRNSLLEPSDGILDNVLGTAAKHGNAEMASEALDLLSKRTRVHPYHYEAVSEAFCRSGNMTGTIQLFCIMDRNGIKLLKKNTRVMYETMLAQPELIDQAETALRTLHKEERIPVTVVNVVIEALSHVRGNAAAMKLYSDAVGLCGEEPGAEVIQTLIIDAQDQEAAGSMIKLYKEAVLDGSDPMRNPEVYNPLIIACVDAGELDLGLRFARLAVSRGDVRRWQLSWLKPLVDFACAKEDGRIWPIVDSIGKSSHEPTAKLMQMILRRMRFARKDTRGLNVGSYWGHQRGVAV